MFCSADLKMEVAAVRTLEDWDVSINKFYT